MPKKDAKYIRFLIQQNGYYYKIFRIQELPDGSLSETLYRRNPSLEPSELGTWKTSGTPYSRIYYGKGKYKDARFDHSIVHSSGVRHLKLKSGGYTHRVKGKPLKSLDHIKHLWTIIPGGIKSYQSSEEIPKGSNFIINLPVGAITGVLHLFAVPKTGNVNLNFDTPTYEKETKMTIHCYRIPLDNTDIVLFGYQSEAFLAHPPKTISIPNLEEFLPVISVITDEYIEFELRKINQSIS